MDSGLAERVLQYVRGQREAFVELLGHLVAAESPSARPDAHRLIVAIIREALGAVGFRLRAPCMRDGRHHLYARRPGRRRHQPAQLLLGHFDTVWPLGTTSRRPFAVDGNVALGPGVFDMKGGIAQMVLALQTLDALRLEPQLEPLVFINSDEEIGSRSSTRYITALARAASRALVLEPAFGDQGAIKTARKGVGRFTVTVHGKAAHAGLDPEAGASAILELAHVIQALFAMNDVHHGVSVNVGTVDGGLQPNVIAAHGQAVVDVRVPTAADGERIEQAILGLQPVTPGVRLTIEGGIGRPSMERTPRNRALWCQARTLGRELGLELEEARAGGGSDGNTTSLYTATLDGLGPVGHGAHAEHEFLDVDRTLERAALLTLLLLAPPADGAAS